MIKRKIVIMKKIIRKSLIILMVLNLAVLIAGCSGGKETDSNTKSKTITIDMEKLSSYLIKNIEFDGQMSSMSSEMAANVFDVSDLDVEMCVYMGTAPCRDMIAIFKTKDANAMKDLKDRVEVYISDVKAQTVDNGYDVSQEKKFDNYVKKVLGDYYIVILSPDNSAAAKTLDEAIEK